MKLKELTVAELETMPYDEIAYLILLESGKKEKLLNLYKKVCNLLKLNFEKEQENVADFFEILSTNKKFVMLDKGYWDLQINHKTNIMVEDALEDISDEDDELEGADELEETEDTEEEIFYDEEDADDDTADDDLSSLVVINEDESETN